jgi:hypothetical protein
MSELAGAIHQSGAQIVLAVTGGGVGAIAELLITPGASRSVLEAIVPYSSVALDRLLGGKPDQYCAEPTARAMAMACYERAKELSGAKTSSEGRLIGLGCTASLASDRPKRGDHRIHVAIQSSCKTVSATLILEKGRNTRQEEDAIASHLIMQILASEAMREELYFPLEIDVIRPVIQQADAPENWQRLLAGQCSWVDSKAGFGDQLNGPSKSPLAIYSGAFHPRHLGHEQIARIGQKRFGQVIHEISICNVDKPSLDFLEMAHRAAQFTPDERLVFTRAATFAEKSRVFPGCTFLVGYDTILRVSDPRYYGGELKRNNAITEIRASECRFLVFGRFTGDEFHAFSSSEVAPSLAEICEAVTEGEFRVDISSTELRKKESS